MPSWQGRILNWYIRSFVVRADWGDEASLTRRDPRASPLFGDITGLPPILLQVGSTELLLDDARQAHARIVAAGGSSRLSVYEDVAHGWHLLAPFVPESRAAITEIAGFLRENGFR